MATAKPLPFNARKLNAKAGSTTYLPLEKAPLGDDFKTPSTVRITYMREAFVWTGHLVVATGSFAYAQVTCDKSGDFSQVRKGAKLKPDKDSKGIRADDITIVITYDSASTTGAISSDLYNE